MFVPKPPLLAQLKFITPSIYEASLHCLAKAAWFVFGHRAVLPEHPAAILGSAFHQVVAVAHKGDLPVTGISDRSPARALFDKSAQKLHQRAHGLVRLKFPSADRLPFYNLIRERAALTATPIAASRLPSVSSPARAERLTPAVRTESRLCSNNGRIVGRADHINGRSGLVVDYKTGHLPESTACVVSDSEARQLRLYAYLASENGINISAGVIVRGDGQRSGFTISPAEAESEADCAKKQLCRLNAAVSDGASFHDLASPSPSNCSFCPCLPFCGPFWTKAHADWATGCGSHVEGKIVEIESRKIQGVSLTTLDLLRRAGTVLAQRVSIEQIPSEWMKMDGLDLPHIGDVVRIVHGRQIVTDGDAAVIRVDKALTSVWRLRRDDVNG